MGKIVYFTEDKKYSAVRFVKSYTEGRWYRKERIEYTTNIEDALNFVDAEFIPAGIIERIHKDFKGSTVMRKVSNDFMHYYDKKMFYVIGREGKKGDEYYGGGAIKKGMTGFTKNISEASLLLALSAAEETLVNLQRVGEKVFVQTVFCNLTNKLLTPVLLITCTDKEYGVTKFYRGHDGSRLRLVMTSDTALKMTYEEAMDKYEYLRAHNKKHLYAIIPAFDKCVNSRNLDEAMQNGLINRSIVMSIKLNYLK